MKNKIGLIGCGNMATAMISGIVKNTQISNSLIIASDLNLKSLDSVKNTFGVNTTTDNLDVAKDAEIIILSVKPQFYNIVIESIRNIINPTQIIITIAPGKTLSWIKDSFLNEDLKITCYLGN